MYTIEIQQGHNSSSYFWIMPAKVRLSNMISYDNVECRDDYEISIEEGDVGCFLEYFFYKYFDCTLLYNVNRHDGCMYVKDRFGRVEFEWWLEHNFFTYSQMNSMIAEIEQAADLLEKDIEDPRLKPIKKNFSIFYMCEDSSDDYIAGVTDNASIKRNISAVTDFYRRFVQYMRNMMEKNPDLDLISVMGP